MKTKRCRWAAFRAVPAILVLLTCTASGISTTAAAPAGGYRSGAGADRMNCPYIRGDADGNGIVNVKDVTVIQRVLSLLEPDPDGFVALRGDISSDGLDIADATAIQSYLAEFGNPYKIGKEVMLEDPDSTQATTQPYGDISLGEDDLPFIWK